MLRLPAHLSSILIILKFSYCFMGPSDESIKILCFTTENLSTRKSIRPKFLHHVMSCHVMSCHVMPRHATPRLATSYHITSYHIIWVTLWIGNALDRLFSSGYIHV